MSEHSWAVQRQVLREQLILFGEPLTWVHQDGSTTASRGLLCCKERPFTAASRADDAFAQLDVRHVAGALVMAVDDIPGCAGDRVLIAEETFFVLPFLHRLVNQVYVSIPLKRWHNQLHNWR